MIICLSFPGSCATKINGAKLEGTAISNGLRSNVEVDACIELCDAEADCHFWSWQGAGANTVCRLFSDRTSQKRVEGAMSGECSLPGWCFRSETNSKFSISFERKLLGNPYPVDLLFNFQSTPMLASACQQHLGSHLFLGSCSSVKLASGKAPLGKGQLSLTYILVHQHDIFQQKNLREFLLSFPINFLRVLKNNYHWFFVDWAVA